MGAAYAIEPWQIFYATIAGAASALVGLLFVAMSLHLPAIVTNPAARGLARESIVAFLSQLMLAILMLIPEQGPRWLGGELLLFGLALVAVHVRFQGQTLRALPMPRRLPRLIHLVPINLGTAMVLAAGATLLLERGGGLFWLVPAVLLYLLHALGNAWALTVHLGKGQSEP